jgi:3-deoxy-D-manno-octulosonic-acid transferase
LLQSGGALEVADAAALAAVVTQLFADPAGRQRVGENGRRVVDANRGSAARVLDLVEHRLTGNTQTGS